MIWCVWPNYQEDHTAEPPSSSGATATSGDTQQHATASSEDGAANAAAGATASRGDEYSATADEFPGPVTHVDASAIESVLQEVFSKPGRV